MASVAYAAISRPTPGRAFTAWIGGKSVAFKSAKEKFGALVASWREGRGHGARLRESMMHPSYQQIIGMGYDAVPLILDELRRRPDQWFLALHSITGEDPAPRDALEIDILVDSWITWGRQRGFIKD